jgi:hypothetical protein
MIFSFLYELRSRKVPVGPHEAVALARALGAGLHQSSLDGFYHVARSLLVHSETHLDAFDQAFLKHFHGVEDAGLQLAQEMLDWLREAASGARPLTPEERQLLESLDLQEIERMLQERLREQRERHDRGNRWVGTAGTSPFGNGGRNPQGIRIGGEGGGLRGAMKQAEARLYRDYRDDLVLDVRQVAVALRKLRAFAREGAPDELDLDGTIDATAKNAGELEVKVRPPRRPNTRVILLMDVGGSMDPWAEMVSRLFTAARKATHFKELRTYYFHNCIYGRVFTTPQFQEAVPVATLLNDCGRHYKLILVGDALMGPWELLEQGGARGFYDEDAEPGIAWLLKLAGHFDRSCWLNPEPRRNWYGTIDTIRQVFEMFPLTLEGLGEAVNHLIRGGRGSPAALRAGTSPP